MRPVTLELQGFGAFRERTLVDFGDAEFFALVGPTGSGKSTVLDAICFALYGNVPRYDDQRLVAAAMSLGANESKVRLTFEVGGERYVVVRIVRRGAQNRVSTREARLERVRDGEVLAGRESELRAAVESVVGLSFDDFTRCVVLPQGEFARFLHDKPADRQALLVRLLDLGIYARLVNRANARAAELQRELDRLGGQASELPNVDATRRAELVDRRERLRVLLTLVDDAEPRLVAAQRELDDLVATETELGHRLAALGAIRPPVRLAEFAERRAAATEALAAAERAADDAVVALDRADADAAAAPEVPVIEHLLVVHERVRRGQGVVAERTATVAAARDASDAAAAARDAACAAREAAAADHRRLEDAHRAHVIALTLRPGEPCPVCEQVVATLPLPAAPAALGESAAELERAAREEERAATRAAGAMAALSDATAQLQAAQGRLDELSAELAQAPDADALERSLAEARAARARLDDARRRAKSASTAVAAARTEVQRLDRALTDEAGAFHRQRDAVVALAPPEPDADLATSWTRLASWAAERGPTVEAERKAASSRLDEVRRTSRQLLAELTEAVIRNDIDLAKPPSLGAIRTALVRADAETAHLLDAIAAGERRRAELDASTERVAGERSVALELARLLKTDRFQRWLVESAFHELASHASSTLRRLSGGQFSLRVGASGEFLVVDHLAADEERSVRTLSGGETFQASLALALALSDHVLGMSATSAQRALESIFLDEGFGTLDPDSLETVASTIETLGADGRMVGIVTHVTELAERVPVRYRVSKGPGGATVRREVS